MATQGNERVCEMTLPDTTEPAKQNQLAPTIEQHEPMGMLFPSKLPYERFVALCCNLKGIGKALQWWWGDLLNYGHTHYSEDEYTGAIEVTGREYQTLMNWQSVAKRVPYGRRVEGLSWSIHAEVAALSAEEQTDYLQQAKEYSLSVTELRAVIHGTPEPKPSARETIDDVNLALFGTTMEPKTAEETLEKIRELSLPKPKSVECPYTGDCERLKGEE